jgi:hypothetical protein
MGPDHLDLASFIREYPVGAALAALGIGFIARADARRGRATSTTGSSTG